MDDNPANAHAERKQGFRWPTAIIVVVGMLLFLKVDLFICGLYGMPDLTIIYGCFLLPVAGIAASCVLVQFILKLCNWKKYRFWTRWVVAAFVVCLYICPIPSRAMSHQWGFSIWVHRNLDVPAVLAWADRVQLPQPQTGPSAWEWHEVLFSNLPPCLLPLVGKPASDEKHYYRHGQMGPLIQINDHNHVVRILYGSSMMGSWGVMIGHGVSEQARREDIKLSDDAYVYDH